MKTINQIIILSLFLLILPLVSAHNASSTTYSVEATNTGLAGSNASSTTYELDDTTSYGGTSNGSSTTYEFQASWANTFCGDGICNGGENCSVCSGDCGTCSSEEEETTTTSTHSGGGGGGGYTTTDLSTTPSKTFKLSEGEYTRFRYQGISHKLTIDDYNSVTETVIITVESTPKTITLLKGETQHVDVDDDGTYDVSVTFSSTSGSNVNILLEVYAEEETPEETISEPITITTEEEPEEEVIEEPEEEKTFEDIIASDEAPLPTEVEKGSPIAIIAGIILLILLIAGAAYYFLHYRHHYI